MINKLRGKNVREKEEGETKTDIKSSSTITSSSRQWAGFKNPRIIRVPRSFGGKDRHSKVFTVRGLRDRRIRLSVPSAVQLYDLQDRLGLNQPSKVVDWLLDITKDDIDKLPPLQMPPGDFTQFYQQTLAPHLEPNTPQSSLSPFFSKNPEITRDGGIHLCSKGLKIGDHDEDCDHVAAASLDADLGATHKEIEREIFVDNKGNVITNTQENGSGISGSYIPQLSAQNFLPLVNQFSFPSLAVASNNTMACNWPPPNLSLFGCQEFPSQVQSHSSTHSPSLPPLAHPTQSQFVLYPHATALSTFSHRYPSLIENDPRNVNQFQFLSSASQNVVPNSAVSPFRFTNPL
ncbi:uncharacterized protein LOC141713129 [Apium graveolens]|uniref:uncharacterized protein LOC141713129 n=1 Tax=Apium graveolens TaxID=4045 RepID=UPI003D7C0CCB